MAYYQDQEDPYGSYAPPLDPYVTEEESFAFYDEGIDPYGEDGLYLSDGVEEEYADGEYGYEYEEELYEEPLYEDDLLFQDDWLPLPPEEIPIETLPVEMRPEDYGAQLYIGGLQHPDPASMRDSYCQFYPEACLEGAGLGGREPFNRTEVAEELDRTLKDIDMTGLAIATVLILILLFGLHYGGATDTLTPKAPTPGSFEDVRARLKAAGYVDPTLAKSVSDTMKLPEDKREAEIERLIRERYKKRLGEKKIKEPTLTEMLEAIMKAKDREAKYKELTKTSATPTDPDKEKYDEALKNAGFRAEKRATALAEIMALDKDKRQAKFDELTKPSGTVPPVADVVDPDKDDKAKYQAQLQAAGITDPQLRRKLREIIALPAGDRQAKCDEIVAKETGTSAPRPSVPVVPVPVAPVPSAAVVVDLESAGYQSQLEAAGIKEPKRLARKLKEIIDLPPGDRQAKCDAIVAAEKRATPPSDSKPRMTSAELDAALIGYGYTDEAKRKPIVDSLARKSRADQESGLETYKNRKIEEGKKAELTKKLQEAGVKDREKLKAEVARLTPMSPADQDVEIAKIKLANAATPVDATKEAEKLARAQLRAELDKALKDGGWTDDTERASKVETLMKIKDKAARDEQLEKYIARKKPPVVSNPTVAATDAAAESAKAAEEVLRRALDAELKEAGYKDDAERATIVADLMKRKESDRARKKKQLIDAKKQVGQGTPSQASVNAARAASDAAAATRATLRTSLENELKEAGHTDPAKIKHMVDTLANEPDETKRKAKMAEYKGRVKPPGSTPAGTETPEQKAAAARETLRASLETELKAAGYTDPAAIKGMVDSLLREKDEAKRKIKMQGYKDRLKAPGANPAGTETPEQKAAKELAAKTLREQLDKELLDSGYTEKTDRDDKVGKLVKAKEGKERDDMLKAYKSRLPGTTGGPPAKAGPVNPPGPTPDAPTAPVLDRAEIEKQLKATGFTDPKAIQYMTDNVLAQKDSKGKAKMLKHYTDTAKDKIAETEKRYAGSQAAKDGTAPPVVPGTTPPEGATSIPMSDADFKRKLEDTKYTPDAIVNMMKEYTGATDEAKKKLEGDLLGRSASTNKKNNDKYKDSVVPGGDPADPKAPLSDEDFRQQLVETKYSPEAIGEMMKEYTGATDDAKRALHTDLVKRSDNTVRKNEAKYKAKAKAAAGAPSTTPPGPTAPLSEEDFKEELKKRKKYSDPAVDEMMKEYKAATTDNAKKALSNKLLVSDPGKQTANDEEYKSKSKVAPGGNPADPAGTKPPKSDEEFKASLLALGYTEPALGRMMDAYKAAGTDEAKKALSDILLVRDTAQRNANQKKYSGTVPPGVTPSGGAMTREKLDAALKALGYDDAATRKRMVDIWDKITDPDEKKKFETKFLNKANKPTYEKRYADTGKVDITDQDVAALDSILKERGYDDGVRAKMISAWKKCRTNADRDKIYDQITSTDPAIMAKNKIDYGPGGSGPPPPETSASPAEAAAAAALRETMNAKLKEKGYDDDAREEILDEIMKMSGTPEEKMAKLDAEFTGRSDGTRKRRNEQYAKKRKDKLAAAAAAAGENGNPPDPSTTQDKLPDDAEIMKQLEAAGWTDPDARNLLLSRIKGQNTPAEQLATLKLYTETQRGTDANNKRYASLWKRDHPDGPNESALPPDETILEALKEAGWTDADARSFLLNRIKGKDLKPAQQLALLEKYTKTEPGNEADNKKYGDRWRRDHPDGTGTSEAALPSDKEILELLEKAGWTDEDARKFLLDRITDKKTTAEEQKANLKKYTRTDPKMATKVLNDDYGGRWRKANPAEPELSKEEKKIDDALKVKGYSADARRKMLSELKDPKHDRETKKKMLDGWKNASDDEVEAINKAKGAEQAVIDVAKGKKDRGDPVTNPPSDPQRPSGSPATPDEPKQPWLTGPQLMLLGLLTLPILLVLSRGFTTPSGQFMIRLPSLPSLPTLRGPLSSTPIMAGGIPISTGLPELSTKRKTKTRKAAGSRPGVKSANAGSGPGGSGPAININNINNQGGSAGINTGSGSGGIGVEEVLIEEAVMEETVVVGEEPSGPIVIKEETIVEQVVVEEPIITVIEEEPPITIEFHGPYDPNRLFWMIACLWIVSIPLLLDYMNEWPIRILSPNEYLSATHHWVVLGAAIFFVLLKVDGTYHWSTRYARPLIRTIRKVPYLIAPAIVGTVEGTESLIWGMDDAVFGKSRELLGLVLASAVFCVAAMSLPFSDIAKGDFADGTTQFLPLLAIGLVTFLFHNASSTIYY